MKKYYCPTCRKFKSRWQLEKKNDIRSYFLVCRWCHRDNICRTEDILEQVINKCLPYNLDYSLDSKEELSGEARELYERIKADMREAGVL